MCGNLIISYKTLVCKRIVRERHRPTISPASMQRVKSRMFSGCSLSLLEIGYADTVCSDKITESFHFSKYGRFGILLKKRISKIDKPTIYEETHIEYETVTCDICGKPVFKRQDINGECPNCWWRFSKDENNFEQKTMSIKLFEAIPYQNALFITPPPRQILPS